MKKNVGSADKIVRYVLAAVLIILFAFKVVTGVWGYVILVIAALAILTSLFSFCPLWAILGISTRKKKEA